MTDDPLKQAWAWLTEAPGKLSEAIASLSLAQVSAAVLAAVALVGVTTDGLPVVVRHQPVAFATAIAACVFIVTASTTLRGTNGASPGPGQRLLGLLVASLLALTVYVAAWGSTEATAARLAVTADGTGADRTFGVTATAELLPGDDLVRVVVTTGDLDVLATDCREAPEDAAETDTTAVEARVGPDAEGTVTWTARVAPGAVEAMCVRAVVPQRCALSLAVGDRCVIGSEAKLSSWLVDLSEAAEDPE